MGRIKRAMRIINAVRCLPVRPCRQTSAHRILRLQVYAGRWPPRRRNRGRRN